MTIVKVSKLTGAALDWAVATIELPPELTGPDEFLALHEVPSFNYSTDWSQGGSIIKREIGNLWKHNKLNSAEPDVWTAAVYRKAPDGTMLFYEEGPTPLIAVMRCYVASELGDEVDIPEELLS